MRKSFDIGEHELFHRLSLMTPQTLVTIDEAKELAAIHAKTAKWFGGTLVCGRSGQKKSYIFSDYITIHDSSSKIHVSRGRVSRELFKMSEEQIGYNEAEVNLWANKDLPPFVFQSPLLILSEKIEKLRTWDITEAYFTALSSLSKNPSLLYELTWASKKDLLNKKSFKPFRQSMAASNPAMLRAVQSIVSKAMRDILLRDKTAVRVWIDSITSLNTPYDELFVFKKTNLRLPTPQKTMSILKEI